MTHLDATPEQLAAVTAAASEQMTDTRNSEAVLAVLLWVRPLCADNTRLRAENARLAALVAELKEDAAPRREG